MVETVTLTDDELEYCKTYARLRQSEAAHLNAAHGFKGNSQQMYEIHYLGVRGELAVAKRLNYDLWVPTVNTFKAPDVGPYWVRTRSKHSWDLIVRSDDPDDAEFILATIEDYEPNKVRIHGKISGREAKKEEYFKAYGGREPAWFVPQYKLTPI